MEKTVGELEDSMTTTDRDLERQRTRATEVKKALGGVSIEALIIGVLETSIVRLDGMILEAKRADIRIREAEAMALYTLKRGRANAAYQKYQNSFGHGQEQAHHWNSYQRNQSQADAAWAESEQCWKDLDALYAGDKAAKQ